jgi:hypothetical protein
MDKIWLSHLLSSFEDNAKKIKYKGSPVFLQVYETSNCLSNWTSIGKKKN